MAVFYELITKNVLKMAVIRRLIRFVLLAALEGAIASSP